MNKNAKNNNPFNIRYNKRNNWQGQLSPVNGFCRFSTLWAGYRAFILILVSYREKGCRNIRSIIERYAPSTENDTARYIDYCCLHVFNNIYSDRRTLSYLDTLNLAIAMHRFESGFDVNLPLLKEAFHAFYNPDKLPF